LHPLQGYSSQNSPPSSILPAVEQH
jgi:hypothetical protein